MKYITILLVLFICLISVIVGAQTYVRPTQSTIAWDAAAAADSYNVYVAPYDGIPGVSTLLGNTTELTFVVTIPTDAPYYVVGVTTIMGSEESEVNWSHVNGANTPEPFIYINLWPPQGLRIAE